MYSDRATAAGLFEWAANKYPSHPWANIGRLEQAIQRFNAGDYAAAQKLTEAITNALKEDDKMVWLRRLYWEAVYLRGCCLQAAGNAEEGERLKQAALGKAPDMQLQNRLRAK